MQYAANAEYVNVEEAAGLLGVSQRQVTRLASLGSIRFLGRGVVERASIAEYLRERESSRSRAWSGETAWAAVALLSGLDVGWLGQAQTSRLRGRLRELALRDKGAYELVGRARNRAEVRVYDSYEFLTRHLRHQIVAVDRQGLGLAGAPTDHLDGYLDLERLPALQASYGLRSSSRGHLVLRATSFDMSIVKHIATEGHGVLAALDSAGSTDPRERGVGARALGSHLSAFRASARIHFRADSQAD